MVKIMVSQPMNGKTKEEIEEERENISKLVHEALDELWDEIIIMDTTVEDHENKTDLECFSESIGFMAEADMLVMGKGWEKARGCILEHAIAKEYYVPILYEP